MNGTPRIYLAGPMFTLGDKSTQLAMADALSAENFDVHLPQRDGIEVATVMGLLNAPDLPDDVVLDPVVIQRLVTWATRTVVALDIYQAVAGCDCVVLNLDGRVPDEGSLVEATAAWYAGRPVVPFKSTPIAELGFNDNPMVDTITRWALPVSDIASVAGAVRAALGSPSAFDAALLPPAVRQLCGLGQVVWDIRTRAPLSGQDLPDAAGQLQQTGLEIIEPVPALQPKAIEVVIGVITLSKLGPAGLKSAMTQLMQDVRQWSTPALRDAIRQNPATA